MKALRLAALLPVLLLVAGCWENQPINNRFLVLSVAVDRAKTPDQTRWTFQMPTPDYLAGLGNGGGASTATSNPFFDISVEAGTFSGAILRAETSAARDLYMGQLQAVFLSTDLPAPRLRAFLDEEGRTGELTHSEFLLAVKGDAARVMATKTTQAPLPSLAIMDHFGCPGCSAARLSVPMFEAMATLYQPSADLALPLIETTQGGLFTVDRVAVYRREHFAGILSRDATLGWAWLTNRVQKESLAIPKGDGQTSIRQVRGRTRVAPRQDAAGRRFLEVHVDAAGTVTGLPPGVTRTSPEFSRSASTAAAGVIRDQVAQALTAAKQSGTEPFGIGPRVRVLARSAFGPPRTWRKTFQALPVIVTVHMALTGSGGRT